MPKTEMNATIALHPWSRARRAVPLALAAALLCAVAPPASAQRRQPAPAPTPVPVPRTEPRPSLEIGFEGLDDLLHESVVEAMDAVRELDLAAVSLDALDMARTGLDDARIEMEMGLEHIDFPDLELEMSAIEFPRMDLHDLDRIGDELRDQLSGLRVDVDVPGIRFDLHAPDAGTFREHAPAPWAPSDSADALYRTARELLNKGEYARAAELFRTITERFPRSTYAADALYWQAFARYRLGSTPELKAALAALDVQRARYPRASTEADAKALATRIRGSLGIRGDSRAASAVEKTAEGRGAACDKEDMAVRIEALNALGQMDADAAAPLLRRVLARRDPCSEGLRRRAVFLLGKRGDQSAAATLADVARTDPDSDVRSDAVLWLARVPGDGAVATLGELARSDDERVQRTAARALAASGSPRARQALRALVESADTPSRVREEAIGALDRENSSAEDAAWLRGIYPKLATPSLRERVISTIARIGGAENDAWLLAVVRNGDEPMQVRGHALSRLARGNTPVTDLVRLYDSVPERELRERLIGVYARREEPQATDKLLQIARSDSVPQLRRAAIGALSRKNDPRTTKLLMEIIDQ